MSTTRRGFLKLLSAAIATPVIAKLSMEAQAGGELILPPSVQAVEVIEPAIVQSGAASFARANRIFCMPGMVWQFTDHVRASAMGALPGGTHFQVRSVPMTGADYSQIRGPKPAGGRALVWVSESDVTPQDDEYEMLGRFMVPKRDVIVPEEFVAVPAHPNSLAAKHVRGEIDLNDPADVRRELEKLTGAANVPKPVEPSARETLTFLERLLTGRKA